MRKKCKPILTISKIKMNLMMRERENYEQGYEKGELHALISLVEDGILSEEKGGERLGISIEQLKEMVEK